MWHLKQKGHLEFLRRKEQKDKAFEAVKPKVVKQPVFEPPKIGWKKKKFLKVQVKPVIQDILPKTPVVERIIPKGVFSSNDNFEHALVKKGYVRLGSGAYSTVYAKGNSDKVIKVTRREDGWIDYVHWANKQGYGGGFAPRVFSYKKFTKAAEPFSVAVVERLGKTLRQDEEISRKYKPITYISEIAANDNDMAETMINAVAPQFGTYLRKMGQQFKGSYWDLHGGNIMLRGEQMVVTDPIASHKSQTTSSRLKSHDFSYAA